MLPELTLAWGEREEHGLKHPCRQDNILRHGLKADTQKNVNYGARISQYRWGSENTSVER